MNNGDVDNNADDKDYRIINNDDKNCSRIIPTHSSSEFLHRIFAKLKSEMLLIYGEGKEKKQKETQSKIVRHYLNRNMVEN